jgi:hypothetical protein
VASTRPHYQGALLSELTPRHPHFTHIPHVITYTPPCPVGDPMTTTYPLSPLLNQAEDRSTNHGKVRFMVAFLTARVVAELLRRAVGSTCEILLPEFDGKGLRAMKLPHRTILRRRNVHEQMKLVGKEASADTFLNHLNWILCCVLNPTLMSKLEVRQILLPKQ